MTSAPEQLFCWNFQTEEDGWEKGWGGYARQYNLSAMDQRERNTGDEYILADLHEAAIRAARIEGYEIARREAASRGLHLVRPELVEVLK